MNLKTFTGILLAFLLVVTACRTTQQQSLVYADLLPIPTLQIITSDLIFRPIELKLPETPGIAEVDFMKKNITETFTVKEKEHVKASDPKLFCTGESEIIYLSLFSETDYAFPLPNAKLISPYKGRRTNHSGVDLKTRANDTIVSVFDGIVRMAKPYQAYGNIIVIRHYNGLETVYSHNSKNLVKPGDYVEAGQPIALTGRTGRATTEHLHFETRINGQHFNPALIFDFESNTLRNKNLLCTLKGNTIKVESIDLFPHQLMSSYSIFTNYKEEEKPKENSF